MTVLEAIEARYSIRQFTDTPVEREIINTLLACATAAPNGSNAQTWRFVAIDDPAIVRKIKMFSPGMGGYPPCIIAFIRDLSSFANKEEAELSSVMDIAMAAENVMIAAVGMKLGTCAIKSYNQAAVSKILGVEAPFQLDLLVTVGYPVDKERHRVRKPMEEVVSYNGFAGK